MCVLELKTFLTDSSLNIRPRILQLAGLVLFRGDNHLFALFLELFDIVALDSLRLRPYHARFMPIAVWSKFNIADDGANLVFMYVFRDSLLIKAVCLGNRLPENL